MTLAQRTPMRWLVPLCFILSGCPRETLSQIAAHTSVLTTDLDFGSLTVGATTTRTVTVQNASRISEDVPVLITAPFTGPSTFTAEPGHTALELTFAPTEVGTFDTTATVNGTTITLHGIGIAAPVCTAGPCEDVEVDVSTGACFRTPKAEGAACAGSTCLTDGTCHAGTCTGNARNCDDANACTTDACTDGQGCIHLDQSASCPPVSDPCHAPACDPNTGCGSVAVTDGTPCGEISCTIANVCLNGSCQQVTPPDGFTCSPATPCQGEGRCQSQHCVQPAKTTLTPKWTYAPSQSRSTFFEGVADPSGSFYWLECQPCSDPNPELCDLQNQVSQCEAVSFTSNGLQRYRTVIPGVHLFPSAQLFDDERYVVAFGSTVVALDGRTGVVQWQRSFDADAVVSTMATSVNGEVLFLEHGTNIGNSTALTRLSMTDGSTLSTTTRGGTFYGLVIDRQSTAWVGFSSHLDVDPPMLLNIDGSSVRESALEHLVQPVSADGAEVVMGDDDVHARSTMQRTHVGGLASLEASLQLSTGRLRTTRTYPGVVLVSSSTTSSPIGHSVAGPFATRSGLIIANGDYTGFTIDLRTRDGVLLTSCETETHSMAIGGAAVFTGSQLAVMTECAVCFSGESELQVFDVTDLGLASSGWIAPHGGPGNARHPR